MKREYLDRSVYDAVQDRFDYLFQEFENIYVSFSGGKDSGLLLNLLMDYIRTGSLACSTRILKPSIP